MNNKSNFDFIGTFPPLGHPEHHFNKYPDHPWLKSKKEIEKFLKLSEGLVYKIHDDLTVSIEDAAYSIPSKDVSHIPFQIRFVRYLSIDGCNLESAIGSPYLVNVLDLTGNKKITSFEGITKNIKTMLDLNGTGIENFKNMPVFKNHIYMYINGNTIESWDGFTNCYSLIFWQDEWCEKKIYDLLMNTPENIEFVGFNFSLNKNNIRMKGDSIDMVWLREEQEKIKKIKQEEKVIEESLITETSHKKRKL